MNTLKEAKEALKETINNKKLELNKLDILNNFLNETKLNKNTNLGDGTIDKINWLLEKTGVRIYLAKNYDFNNQKTLTIYYYIKAPYKHKKITEFYDCISNLSDIKSELDNFIVYRKKELQTIIESNKWLAKAVKMRDKLKIDIENYNKLNHYIRDSINKWGYESDFRVYFK